MSAKNPGLAARVTPIQAAIQASRTEKGTAAEEAAEPVTTSVRLPKPLYDALLDIVHAAKKRGEKESIHAIILKGIEREIASRK